MGRSHERCACTDQSSRIAAQRLGVRLPRRERLLIDAGVAIAGENYARLCTIAQSLITQDSTDIQGVFLLGECSFHDDAVVRATTDTMAGAFRGSWNTAIRSFRRVIELDPTYLGAFEHVIQMLQRERRGAVHCGTGAETNGCPMWMSWVLRSGDTLEIVPVHPGIPLRSQPRRRAGGRKSRPSRITRCQLHCAGMDPGRPQLRGARVGLARAALMLGDAPTADSQLKRVKPRASVDNLITLRLMLEVAGKLGHGTEGRAIFDSLVRILPDNRGRTRVAAHLISCLAGSRALTGRAWRLLRHSDQRPSHISDTRDARCWASPRTTCRMTRRRSWRPCETHAMTLAG